MLTAISIVQQAFFPLSEHIVAPIWSILTLTHHLLAILSIPKAIKIDFLIQVAYIIWAGTPGLYPNSQYNNPSISFFTDLIFIVKVLSLLVVLAVVFQQTVGRLRVVRVNQLLGDVTAAKPRERVGAAGMELPEPSDVVLSAQVLDVKLAVFIAHGGRSLNHS